MSPIVTTKARRPGRRRAAVRPVDPVAAYALRVLVGAGPFIREDGWRATLEEVLDRYVATEGPPQPIVAGRAVRLACERHFRDLSRQRTAAFPYYWDEDAALHIIDFFPEFLTLENGDPFHLPPWIQFAYGFIFGWKCWGGDTATDRELLGPEHVARAGYRRIQHGFLETSKGSGKTPSAGGLGIYGIAYDDEPHAQVYSTGFDEGQANLIVFDAVRMANVSPTLLEECIVDKYNIAHPSSGSFFRAMSSQHRSKSGPRPHYVLSDEIHEHRDGTVVMKAEAGFKNRRQPLGLKYTNSGDNRESYCWQLHQKSIDVLEGTVPDEQWFAYVCHLDTCPACFAEGYRQPKDGCAECDDWTAPAVWPKIAPALGIVIQPKYLRDALHTALTIPSEFATKRRLNFCIWTETHQTWMSTDLWNSCKVPAVHDANPEKLPAVLGLDPSSIHDLTAAVVALRIDDPPSSGPAEEVAIEGLDEHGAHLKMIFTLNYHVELVPFFWLPRETLNDRVKNDRIPFDHWEREGRLFVSDGPAIDHQAIYDFIIGTKDTPGLWKRYALQKVGMDQNHGLLLFQQLQGQGRLGKNVVSIGQGKKMSEAFKFMEILVRKRRLRHDGHPVLAMNVANAEPHRDRLGALWLEKANGEQKKVIDGVIASAMAIHQLMTLPFKKRSIGVFSV